MSSNNWFVLLTLHHGIMTQVDDSLGKFGEQETGVKEFLVSSLRHFSIQSEVEPKPIVSRSHTFSHALHELHGSSVSFAIGQIYYFSWRHSVQNNSNQYFTWSLPSFSWPVHLQKNWHCGEKLTVDCCVLVLDLPSIVAGTYSTHQRASVTTNGAIGFLKEQRKPRLLRAPFKQSYNNNRSKPK